MKSSIPLRECIYCNPRIIGVDTTECKRMPDMLGCPKISEEDKGILERFYNNAKIRIQQIFNCQSHIDNLLHTIRGLKQNHIDISVLSGRISTFDTLFQDTLDDTGVLNFLFQNHFLNKF